MTYLPSLGLTNLQWLFVNYLLSGLMLKAEGLMLKAERLTPASEFWAVRSSASSRSFGSKSWQETRDLAFSVQLFAFSLIFHINAVLFVAGAAFFALTICV